MSSKLDKYLDMLQQDIFLEARKTYGEKGYDRWKNPRFTNMIDRVDSHSRLTGSCGDTMEMYLQMDDEVIFDICYRTDGCASSIICGSFAAEIAHGKTAEEVLDLTGDSILREIGDFPGVEQHCAHLAITTIKEALHQYMSEKAHGNRKKESP